MDPQPKPKQPTQSNSITSTYAKSWNQFIDKAMPILVQNPTQARYTLKFIPRRNWFVLKVTDGSKIVMKRCHASQEYQQIQKFTRLATRALTNQVEQEKVEVEDKTNKDKKKKKKK